MDSEFKRLLLAMLVALGAYMGLRYVVGIVYPPSQGPTPATQPAAPPAEGSDQARVATQPGQVAIQPDVPPPPATTTTTTGLSIRSSETTRKPVLGGREGDALRVELDPVGAGVTTIDLWAQDEKGRFVHRATPDENEPYEIIHAIDAGVAMRRSFTTDRIWIEDFKQGYDLSEVLWHIASESPTQVVFSASLVGQDDGQPLIHLTKTYTLRDDKPVFDIHLQTDNRSGRPLSIWLEQNGPIGINAEHHQYDMRKLLVTQKSASTAEMTGWTRNDLHSAARDPDKRVEKLLDPDREALLWTALANKYFAVYTRPVADVTDGLREPVRQVYGTVAVPGTDENLGDMIARLRTAPLDLPPQATTAVQFEIYAGPKDPEYLRKVDPAYTDKAGLYYQLAQSADQRCCCTFEWLRELMVWLLESIHFVVRNYGIAIIILVIIIRSLLHPLTVFQQKSMFRMQESMSRIQPKMQAIKEKYPNDKVKQNQEMMKMWGEEGVNPLANFVSFVPLFLQMPILVALWTALNTDIHLRHAPFWIVPGHWIEDLSAPDGFLTFSPVHVPIVSWIMGEFTSLNLLPILMGVSMWLQQKYMPKPHLKAKLEAAKAQKAENKPQSGMSPEDQLRQQQIMMYMMSFLFPLMFYKMPAGLNLYWLATNVFGIGESLLIRRQLDREKSEREKRGPAPPKPKRGPGPIGRFFKHIAQQAEELQKKADELSEQDGGKRKKDDKNKRDK